MLPAVLGPDPGDLAVRSAIILRDGGQGGLGLQEAEKGWIKLAAAATGGWHFPGIGGRDRN